MSYSFNFLTALVIALFTAQVIAQSDPFKSVLINEVMYDPTPTAGLPEAEYVELVNVSPDSANLSGWSFSANGRTADLPSGIIAPGEFVVLTDPEDRPSFADHVPVLELPRFPALSNTGALLELRDANSQLVDAVEYEPGWHDHQGKKQGGWSLERVNYLSPCTVHDGWRSARQLPGGTPGRTNSVSDLQRDTAAPLLTAVHTRGNGMEIVLLFNEILTKDTVLVVSDPPLAIDFVSTDGNSVTIGLAMELPRDTAVQIELIALADCAGNMARQMEFPLRRSYSTAGCRLVLNEILFDPWPACPQFVEILNISGWPCSLDDVIIGIANEDYLEYTNVSVERDIQPGEAFAYSEDPLALARLYRDAHYDNIARTDLPTLNRARGAVILKTSNGHLLDSMAYSDDIHNRYYSSTRGLSIERIDPEGSSTAPHNWYSASESAGWATPGASNSRSSSDAVSKQYYHIVRDVVNPLDPHLGDLFQIILGKDAEKALLSVDIFDLDGRLVDSPVSGYSGKQGTVISWGGHSNSGAILRKGVYIALLQFVGESGGHRIFKEAFALAPGQ